jgi:selenocysteine lyase/cysteine desulfurase
MPFDLGHWLPEFPIRESCLYLDHAAVCPLPFPVAEAMRRQVTDQQLTGYANSKEWHNSELACRHLGGQILGCDSEDISIIRSTSEGLSLIAEGLSWKTGDEVLVGEEEFAANVAPWLNLKSKGVRVIRYPQPDGRIDPADVADAITDRTRLLSVSWVAFHSGWVAPLDALATLCRERNVLTVVDAIQGLGVMTMNMRALGIDAVVADGHKWLLGPEGAGLMAISSTLRPELRPAITGWRNIHREPGSFFLHDLEFLDNGRRFEPGATNTVGIAGLGAALDLLNNVGHEQVQARVEMLARLLTRVLLAHGWDVFSPGSGQAIAGIVAARPAKVASKEAAERLAQRKVVCSVRQGSVRLSPHFYTTKGELEAFDRILEKVGL